MKFKNKKVGESQKYETFYDMIKSHLNAGFFVKFFIIVVCLGILYFYAGYAVNFTKDIFKKVSISAVNTISTIAGEEMKQDELGQINVLILGYGGEGHQGSFLSDTIIVASFNPKLGSVSMLSLPRDLMITSKYHNGKINGLFAMAYHKNKSYDEAVNALKDKMNDMLGIKIDYYALVDFKGFVNIVDSLGGVDVDVPQDLVDTQYPNENWGYETFSVKKGQQHFDGKTALKYARSRHSTSDFSRSHRQQLIIRAVLNKMISLNFFTNLDKMKEMYGNYNTMVKTNISLKNMLGMAKYVDQIKHFFTFNYSAECDTRNYKTATPGCLLYYPPREAFGGASTVLPQGATPANISYYKYMQDFAFNVVYQQQFLVENAGIRILNGTGKTSKTKKGETKTVMSDNSKANALAARLKINAFNIQDVDKAPKLYDKTTLFVNGTGDYKGTIDALKMFVNIDEILTGATTYLTGKDEEMIPNDLTLILAK